jgi:hypothetical protein
MRIDAVNDLSAIRTTRGRAAGQTRLTANTFASLIIFRNTTANLKIEIGGSEFIFFKEPIIRSPGKKLALSPRTPQSRAEEDLELEAHEGLVGAV